MEWTRETRHWRHDIGAEVYPSCYGWTVVFWHQNGCGHPGPFGHFPTLKEAKKAAEAEAERRHAEAEQQRLAVEAFVAEVLSEDSP